MKRKLRPKATRAKTPIVRIVHEAGSGTAAEVKLAAKLAE
jgi:hypothetical protein